MSSSQTKLMDIKIIQAPKEGILTGPNTEEWVGCELSAEVNQEEEFYFTSARRLVKALFQLGKLQTAFQVAAHFSTIDYEKMDFLAQKYGWPYAFYVCGYYTRDARILLPKEDCKILGQHWFENCGDMDS